MKQYFEKYPLAFVTAATFLFIVFSNSAIKDPVFDTEEKKISFLQITGQYEAADKAFLKWLDDKPDEMDVHYKYLHNHFRIAEKKKNEKSENVYRDDRSIREYYTLKLTSQKTEEKDIGFYGLGLLDIMQGDYANALLDFDSVSNRNLKYLNNSVGYILMERNRSKEAEEMFQKEIAQNGYVAGAYSNLGRLYYKSGDSKKLGALLANPKAEKYVPVEIREAYYFRAGNMVQYLREILYETTTHINLFGFLAALLIMGSWMMYLRRIDLLHQQFSIVMHQD